MFIVCDTDFLSSFLKIDSLDLVKRLIQRRKFTYSKSCSTRTCKNKSDNKAIRIGLDKNRRSERRFTKYL